MTQAQTLALVADIGGTNTRVALAEGTQVRADSIRRYSNADYPGLEPVLRAYLAGEPRPYLEENPEFQRDALSFKVRLDFAAGVIDHRALFKNPGA